MKTRTVITNFFVMENQRKTGSVLKTCGLSKWTLEMKNGLRINKVF